MGKGMDKSMDKSKIGVPLEGLADLSRKAAAEGAVLLRNENEALPLTPSDHVSVFGRCQIDYYRSGTGSGGAVNVAYRTNLLDGLRNSGGVCVNEKLAAVYEEWIRENPFDDGGGGWACEPWSQKEMPVTEELAAEAAGVSNKAIIVIGRTAGEDQDNAAEEGSYLLTGAEMEMLRTVTNAFSDVIVVLNVSNLIDMSFLDTVEKTEHIRSVIYAWQGGMEGGNAIADVLTGKTVPQGKLTDTIARCITDYPSDRNHGADDRNVYQEDIYVGYRYFETFRRDAVMFPFGFGMSYTRFEMEPLYSYTRDTDGALEFVFSCRVRNAGEKYSGREVVQVYVEGPQEGMGRPSRELVGFQKTKLLNAGESETVEILVPLKKLASYCDDAGDNGENIYANCYVVEKGEYRFHMGSSVRDTQAVIVDQKESYYVEETIVTETCEEAMAPVTAFERLSTGKRKADGIYEECYSAVPLQQTVLKDRILQNLPREYPVTGDRGFTLQSVAEGECTMEEFIAQLSEEDLATIVRGEGMCSIKVTPGTASAFGGVSDRLLGYGIPIACCADGPSGIRMDSGLMATQLPIGTLLACTWDPELVEELYTMQGKEMLRNRIDTLLGPGINIHRHPLNGRNFEYFSEDPLITGKMAAAMVRGIGRNGVHATVKHFACNSQEKYRNQVEAVISQRALREIYLKGFELAVKEGNAQSIMTSYNPINGHWAASNYDLNTTILRKEWGYTGIVMTDWWATMNDVAKGGPASPRRTGDMVRAQNDLYMVVSNNGAELNSSEDDTLEALAEGRITLGELQRNAANICNILIKMPAFQRAGKEIPQMPCLQSVEAPEEGLAMQMQKAETAAQDRAEEVHCEETGTKPVVRVELNAGAETWFYLDREGIYGVVAKLMSPENDRAQTVCKACVNGMELNTFQTNGTLGRWIYQKLLRVHMEKGWYRLTLEFPKPGMQVDYLEFAAEE